MVSGRHYRQRLTSANPIFGADTKKAGEAGASPPLLMDAAALIRKVR